MTYLVLLRHGQSQWNLENRFTGWVDVALTEKGEQEARQAGEKIQAAGLQFDTTFTSVLQRAIRTLELVLEVLGQPRRRYKTSFDWTMPSASISYTTGTPVPNSRLRTASRLN